MKVSCWTICCGPTEGYFKLDARKCKFKVDSRHFFYVVLLDLSSLNFHREIKEVIGLFSIHGGCPLRFWYHVARMKGIYIRFGCRN